MPAKPSALKVIVASHASRVAPALADADQHFTASRQLQPRCGAFQRDIAGAAAGRYRNARSSSPRCDMLDLRKPSGSSSMNDRRAWHVVLAAVLAGSLPFGSAYAADAPDLS